MDAELEIELIECLDALAQGESVERILARYPQDAAQLRPLLQTAVGLPTLRMEPSEAVKMRARQKFLAQAAALRIPAKRQGWAFLPRFATGFVAAALVAVVLSTGAVAASGSSLPGDPLYGLKRTVENVQLGTTGSPVVRDELQREFEQRRRDEANRLLDAGRESEVELTGPIESIQPGAWVVGGLAISINASTTIVGTPQLNRLAEVKGVTGPGGLRATSITIESASEADQTPESESTATPAMREITATPQPSATSAPTHGPGTQPAATPRATARPQPTAPATAEPVEVEFTGSVQAIDGASWSIDGTTISVNANTELVGSINLGQRVKVHALRQGNGQLIAMRIEPIEDGGGGGGDQPKSTPTPKPTENHNGNRNSNDGNGNSNDNRNENRNENENRNSNDNRNGNRNENENRNENHNSNTNTNSNDH
jgi:hypothetical protein